MKVPDVLHLERSWAAPAADPQASPQTQEEFLEVVWSQVCDELGLLTGTAGQFFRGSRFLSVAPWAGGSAAKVALPLEQLAGLLLQAPVLNLLLSIEARLQDALGDELLALQLVPIQEPSTAGEVCA